MAPDLTGWPSRLYALDASRGLAALVVVLWHWQHFAFAGAALPADFERSSQPLYALLRMFYEGGELTVDYFFALSGFIFFWLYAAALADRTVGAGEFWVQRFSRLYPLHIVSLLMVVALQGLYMSREATAFVYPNNDTWHFLLNLLLASSWGVEKGYSFNGPIWSVSVELLLYAAFFVLAYRGRSQAWLLACISVAAFSLYQKIGYQPVLRGIAMFFLGGVVFHAVVRLARPEAVRGRRWIYGLVLLCWLVVLCRYYVFDVAALVKHRKVGRLLFAWGPYYIMVPLTIAALALIEIRRGVGFARLACVGDITYASYLLHFPMQIVAMLLVSHGLLDPRFYLHPASLLVFYSLLVYLSWQTFRRFERPAQNWIRRRYAAHGNEARGPVRVAALPLTPRANGP